MPSRADASADNLDPHASSSSPELGQAFRENVYSKLTDLLPSGAYGMQLAESMESNHAATLWHIKLKKGVTWHDGSPLTADDVIYTFRRILDPKGDYGSAASNIPMIDRNGMKKVNDHELTMKLNTPWIDLPSAVGQRFVSIVKAGSKAPYTVENTNGTGPFKLSRGTARRRSSAWSPTATTSSTASRMSMR